MVVPICFYKLLKNRTERGIMNLHQPLTVLPSVGPKSAEKFTKLGIESLQDLLLYFPFRYEDFKSKNPGKYYFFTRYGKKNHTEFDFSNTFDNIYLIFGKESTGIPLEILKDNLDNCIRIPMSSNVRCLNVSNSVAIAVYEVLRQQNFNNLSFTEIQKGEDYLFK